MLNEMHMHDAHGHVGVGATCGAKTKGLWRKTQEKPVYLTVSSVSPPAPHRARATRHTAGGRRTAHGVPPSLISQSHFTLQQLSELIRTRPYGTLPVVRAHCTSTCTIQHPLALRRSFKCIIRVREPVHINNKE